MVRCSWHLWLPPCPRRWEGGPTKPISFLSTLAFGLLLGNSNPEWSTEQDLQRFQHHTELSPMPGPRRYSGHYSFTPDHALYPAYPGHPGTLVRAPHTHSRPCACLQPHIQAPLVSWNLQLTSTAKVKARKLEVHPLHLSWSCG